MVAGAPVVVVVVATVAGTVVVGVVVVSGMTVVVSTGAVVLGASVTVVTAVMATGSGVSSGPCVGVDATGCDSLPHAVRAIAAAIRNAILRIAENFRGVVVVAIPRVSANRPNVRMGDTPHNSGNS